MRAMPKSAIFTLPFLITMTFPGLMSRCHTRRSCACASASSNCDMMLTASRSANRVPRPMYSRSELPSTYSMAMYETEASSP